MVAGVVTPVIASRIAGAFGVPEGAVRKVLSVGVPVLLAAFLKRASSPGGADSLTAALGGMGKNPLEALGSALSGDAAQAQAAATSGSDLLSGILGGGGVGTLASKLAGYAGVDGAAAGPLLGLAGSMALGGLKQTADAQGLDAGGLMRLLGDQKNAIAAAIPGDFAKALGGTDLIGSDILKLAQPAAPRPAAAAAPAPKKAGLTRWLVPLVVLLAVLWLASRFLGGAPEEAATTEAPAPAVVEGADIGQQVEDAVMKISSALSGVTDATTAETAAAALTEAGATLAEAEGMLGSLGDEAKAGIASMILAQMPTIQGLVDKLLADPTLGPILKPAIDAVMARLAALDG